MKRGRSLTRTLLLGFFLAGVFVGIFARLYHNCHHRFTLFISPEHVEAYIDGECLNIAHPLPLHHPRIELHFIQMLQRPHEAQFLQVFSDAVIREPSLFSETWEYDGSPPAHSGPENQWGSGFLRSMGLAHRAGFGHFIPLFLDHETLNRDRFALDLDVIMPTSMRIHFVNDDNRTRNIFGADVYAGSYAFALDSQWEWTQRYFINDSMARQLKNLFAFRILSGAAICLIFLIFVTGCAWGIIRLAAVIDPVARREGLSGVIRRVKGVRLPRWSRGFGGWWEIILIAMLAFTGAWLVSAGLFRHIPRVNDEAVYLFQARIFASGRWFIPPPEPVECFKHLGIWWPDRVFSYYTYGHSMILAAGFLTKTVRYFPALISTVALVFTVLSGRVIYKSRLTGFFAGILLISSPLFIILGGSYMSHGSSIAANMVFLFFIARARETERRRDHIAAGLALGTAFVIRPVTAGVFALFPLIIWSVSVLRHRRFAAILLLILTCGTVASTVFLHAYLTTGNWEPIQKQVEDRFETGNDEATTWKYMVQNTTWFLMRGFGWIPYATLLFAFLPFALGSRNVWDWVFLAGFMLNAYLFSAIAHFGWTHEPRYWSEFMPLVALLSARGIQRLAEVMTRWFDTRLAGAGAGMSGVLLAFLLIIGSVRLYWPYEIEAFTNYCYVRDDTYMEVLQSEVPNSIFFFQGPPDYIYIPHFYRNRIPDFQGSIIYAMYHSDASARILMDRYPDRHVFIVRDGRPVERIR